MSWDFINTRTVKAAKPHRCYECRGQIAKGEAHEYTSGKVEGDLTSYRLCAPCADLAAAYCREFDDGEGFPLGEMRQVLRDDEGIEDIDAWLAESNARYAAEIAERARRRARLDALGSATICGRCGATIATYSDKCSAALDDACPGFMAIERASTPPDGPISGGGREP